MNAFGIRSRAFVGGMLLLGACGVWAQDVPTMRLEGGKATDTFAVEGVVQAVQQTTVAAQTNGRILSLRVKAGDPVKAGQLLATIDDRETTVGNERSQAQLLQAEAEQRTMQAQYERTRDLQQKGFVSKAALDAASLQLQSAQAAREQARASIKLSAIAQGYTRVTAPYDGWVLQTFVQTGDLAVPGTPLITVYAPQPLRVVAQMPASRATEARAATQTEIELQSATPNAAAIRPVSRQIIPSADPVSQTSEWRWDIAAKDSAALIPGQPVRVLFEGVQPSGSARLWVPLQAIVRRGELSAVYVANNGGFALRAIRLGANRTAQAQEVLSGLRAGEVIALDPVKAAAIRSK